MVQPLIDEHPVLLLRGLSREQRHWGTFRTLLAQHLLQPVLSMDLPGMGERFDELSPVTLHGIVAQLRSRLPQQPRHLLAMSMGAMVALQWAAEYPDEVASLVLINTSAGQLTPFYQRLKWQSYPSVLQALVAPLARREQIILQLTANHRPQRQQQLADWLQWARERPVRRHNVLRQLWAASRFQLPQQPNCPILLLASERDRVVDCRASQQIAQLWQVPLHLHPTAGHDLALDDPDWLLQQVSAFYQLCAKGF